MRHFLQDGPHGQVFSGQYTTDATKASVSGLLRQLQWHGTQALGLRASNRYTATINGHVVGFTIAVQASGATRRAGRTYKAGKPRTRDWRVGRRFVTKAAAIQLLLTSPSATGALP